MSSVILAAVAFLVASPAHASGEVLVSLDYETDPALPECPPAADFRREIVQQLGHDPFREGAPRRVVVRLYPKGSRTGGRVEWRDANDEWEGERTFSSRTESCAQMAWAMALATAIQIQLLTRVEEDSLARPVRPPDSKQLRPAADDVKPAVQSATPAAVALAIAPTTATTTTTAPPAARRPGIAVDVGVGVIQDFGDSPAVILPRVAVWWDRPSAIGLRLTFSGLGPAAEIARPEGVAQIERLVMTLELIRFFRPGRIVQPLLAVGGGWQDVRARGTSAMPSLAPAHQGQALSGTVSASGGLAFELATRLSALVEVETLVFRPAVTVRVGSAEAAHLDGVALFVHGGLLARF